MLNVKLTAIVRCKHKKYHRATEVVSLEVFALSHFPSYSKNPTALRSYVRRVVVVAQCEILITAKNRYSAMFVHIWNDISSVTVNQNII
jgi:hypothetical protein